MPKTLAKDYLPADLQELPITKKQWKIFEDMGIEDIFDLASFANDTVTPTPKGITKKLRATIVEYCVSSNGKPKKNAGVKKDKDETKAAKTKEKIAAKRKKAIPRTYCATIAVHIDVNSKANKSFSVDMISERGKSSRNSLPR